MPDKDLFGNEIPEPEPEQTFRISGGEAISETELQEADEETQIDAMRQWFLDNFINPEEEHPYDSEEGCYHFMFGGPYSPSDEIEAKFSDITSEEARKKVISNLENLSTEWDGLPGPDDHDDYDYESIAAPSEHIKAFTASVANIRKLIKTAIDPDQEQFFLRMLFASAITSLETYLSDRFISSIRNNPKALRRFVESYSQFQKESIRVKDIFKKSDELEKTVSSILVNQVLWHRLGKVTRMFEFTFGVNVQGCTDLKDLKASVFIRHDIVHRNGKNKEGIEHVITAEAVEKLIAEASLLVSWIDLQESKFLPEAPPDVL